jgi:uncharacterized membrane protein YbaN (DUF454 family)
MLAETPIHFPVKTRQRRLMSLFVRLKKKWRRLTGGKPGHRFQDYYRRSRREKNRDEGTPRIVRLAVAVVLFCIGVVLVFLPVVYIPFFVASAALFASESLPFARFLDHSEVWVDRNWDHTKERYGLTHREINFIVVTLSLGCLVLAGFMCYKTFLR